MRFIRRLLERNSSLAWLLTPSLAIGGAVASCTSDESQNGIADDAGADGTVLLDDGAALDDASDGASPRDAAPFDGGPRSVACVSAPCAVSLVRAFNFTSPYDTGETYCALLDDGTVACWGAGVNLGRGSDYVDTLDDATAKRVLSLSNIVRLYPSCGVDKSGAVWCWGIGQFPTQDSDWMYNPYVPIRLPLPPAKNVAIANYVGCALVDDADVRCWGRNTGGLIAPISVAPSTATLLPQRVPIPAGAPIRELLVGDAIFAVREDGIAVSWGANPPLGRVSSFEPDLNPMPIPLEGISSIDLSPNNACATAGGVGYCWGNANAGLSPPFVRLAPEPVATPEPIVQITTTATTATVSSPTRPQRWCAVGASGDVYCWGYNAGGQAGDGTKNHAYQTVKVEGLPEKAVEVAAFPDSTCALLTNGKVYCWGTNRYGQLGNRKIGAPSLVPQEVELP